MKIPGRWVLSTLELENQLYYLGTWLRFLQLRRNLFPHVIIIRNSKLRKLALSDFLLSCFENVCLYVAYAICLCLGVPFSISEQFKNIQPAKVRKCSNHSKTKSKKQRKWLKAKDFWSFILSLPTISHEALKRPVNLLVSGASLCVKWGS